MNFGELKSTLGRKVDIAINESEGGAYIKEAYQTILGMYRGKFREASAETIMIDGQSEYSFEDDFGVSDVRKIIKVSDISSRNRYTPADYSEKSEVSKNNSMEYIINPDYSAISVYPEAAGNTLEIIYERRHVLNADSDEPLFDEDYHLAIVHLAAKSYLEEKDRDPGMASYHEEQATKIIKELMVFDRKRSYDRITQFKNIYSISE